MIDAGERAVVLSVLSEAAELDELVLVQLYVDFDVDADERLAAFAARVNGIIGIGALLVDRDAGVGFRHVNAFAAAPMLELDALTQLVGLVAHQVDRLAPALARVAGGEESPDAAVRALDV